ncbi:hypothetical protein Tco_0501274, partial [Tanacetum coccineum]
MVTLRTEEWIRIFKKRTKNKATTNKTEHEMEKKKKG